VLPALSIAAFALMVGGILGLFAGGQLFATHAVPIAIQAAAVLLMLWARITFGRRSFHAGADPTAGALVTTGPYAYVRHPIYAAVLYFVWATALDHRSVLAIGCAAVVTAGAFLRMLFEERLLTAKYAQYAAYQSRVKRILPAIF
jgi:protein-S-isoprenylcysteine O-methyltransferase Ste14